MITLVTLMVVIIIALKENEFENTKHNFFCKYYISICTISNSTISNNHHNHSKTLYPENQNATV